MILTIKGADFSGSGLGTNTSMSISYNGNVTGTPGFIEKNTALTSKITIKTGYTYDSISSVTVGGSVISGYTAIDNGDSTVTLTIPAELITGKVVINVSTTATSTGGGEEDEPGIGGDTNENKIMLYNNYTLQQNKTLGSSGISTSSKTGYHTYELIPVEPNMVYYIPGGIRVAMLDSSQNATTSVNIYSSSNVGQQFYVKTGDNTAYVYVTILDTLISVEDAYIQKAEQKVTIVNTTVISTTSAVLKDDTKLNPSSYGESSDENYCAWIEIPIEGETYYKVAGSARVWFLDSSKSSVSSVNPTAGGVPEKFAFITPASAAYVSISLYKNNMDKTANELEMHKLNVEFTPVE